MMPHDHHAAVSAVRAELPPDELLSGLANLYKLFGDGTRVKILFALLKSELCVCAIAELLDMTQSAISHQLRLLREANLVACRREGKTVYYHLSDRHVEDILSEGFEHLGEEEGQ